MLTRQQSLGASNFPVGGRVRLPSGTKRTMRHEKNGSVLIRITEVADRVSC
jgi:hypothetical protein